MPENLPFPGATKRQVIWGRESLAVGPVRFNEEEWHRGHLGLRKFWSGELMLQELSEPSGKETNSPLPSAALGKPLLFPLYLPWGRE